MITFLRYLRAAALLIAVSLLLLAAPPSSPRPPPSPLPRPPPPEPTGTTIVTAYFRVATSKHTPAAFLSRMRTFFSQVGPSGVVVFTSPDLAPTLAAMPRGGGLPPLRFILQDTVWNSSWAAPLEENFRTVQRGLDFGNAAPELYAIWSSKVAWTAAAAAENPFNTKYFLFVDVGSQRTPELDFSPWPDEGRVASLFEGREGRAVLSAVAPFDAAWDWRRVWPHKGAQIQGGVFGGTAAALLWLNATYSATFEELRRRGYFAAQEQGVLSVLAVEHKERLLIIDAGGHKGVGCRLSAWFYFWAFFAPPGRGDARCVSVPVHAFEASAGRPHPLPEPAL